MVGCWAGGCGESPPESEKAGVEKDEVSITCVSLPNFLRTREPFGVSGIATGEMPTKDKDSGVEEAVEMELGSGEA